MNIASRFLWILGRQHTTKLYCYMFFSLQTCELWNVPKLQAVRSLTKDRECILAGLEVAHLRRASGQTEKQQPARAKAESRPQWLRNPPLEL